MIAPDLRDRLVAIYGETVVRFAEARGISAVKVGRRYLDASPELRRLGVDVDRWPIPPAGLFVVAERTLYLRDASDMVLAHEFAHALDCALGGGEYRSSTDPAIRRAFARARTFVTPYAATGLDEYFAESVRAYVGANDDRSPWPKVSRERLRSIDPAICVVIRDAFAEIVGATEVAA